MYLNTQNKKECTGCSACESICPKNCISMEIDNEGFKYPKINLDECIHCHLCETVCPIDTEVNVTRSKFVSGYSKSKDIHKSGSSGGFNYGFARYFLEQGGYVFGVVLDDQLKAKHVCIHSIGNILSICKSKYIQSDISHIFEDVKKLLELKKMVMFTGTPCQVNGLYKYLNKDYENLLIIDFACQGVCSQSFFDNLIEMEEKQKNIKIVKFMFRSKSSKLFTHPHYYAYEFVKENKLRKREGDFFDFPFYYAYKTYNFFRPSCYNCKYNSNKRISDVTLSDFWKGQKYYKDIKIKKGVSLLMLNTKKGEKFFDYISDNYEIKVHDENEVSDFAGWRNCAIRDDKQRNNLMNKYMEMDIKEFCKIYLNPKITYKLRVLLPYCVPLWLIRLKRYIGGHNR
ncbi:Coenzyme F420 hydrogenase/dehydrogenase, beta subunit C-terminal domain [[Clostridium] innocuum]|nr:Coenzyme F420 hydrogenase/dehydrogenase, beta subunit C-terminal domain [[Clostridium] innocuum]